MLSDIIETASSLHIRGFSGGKKEEQLGNSHLSYLPGSDSSLVFQFLIVSPTTIMLRMDSLKASKLLTEDGHKSQ